MEYAVQRCSPGCFSDVPKFLIDRGADVNAKDKHGTTILHRAARSGKWDAIQWLVEQDADVNAKADNGNTVLSEARKYGNELQIQFLIEHGAK